LQAETPKLIAGSRAQKWDKSVIHVRNNCLTAMRVAKINFTTVGKKSFICGVLESKGGLKIQMESL
jgi:hypothetical protein